MRLIDADKISEAKFHPLPYTHITPTDVDAESYKRGWNDAIDAIITEEPTAEEPQWIPCSDHTPYTPMRVQVQLENGWIITAYRQEGEWLSVPDCGDALRDECVVAWMPLPEPYKEGGAE